MTLIWRPGWNERLSFHAAGGSSWRVTITLWPSKGRVHNSSMSAKTCMSASR